MKKLLNEEEITECTFNTHCTIDSNAVAVYNPQVLLAGQPEFNSCVFGDCLHSAVSCQKPVFSHPFHLRSPRSHRYTHGAQQAHLPSKKRYAIHNAYTLLFNSNGVVKIFD